MSLLASLATMVDQHQKPETRPEYRPEITKPPPEALKDPTMLSMEKLLHIRNRTSISKEQAKILQNVFELNQFPDSEVRKKLEGITGLPGRVIQVWFQNRRREKKLLVKQKEQVKVNETINFFEAPNPSNYQEL